tara:strand:+ start:1950 stop:3194 length:1245 start_codon:yes stop_codon:yes gene_type:complete
MKILQTLRCDPKEANNLSRQLAIAIENEEWIQLLPKRSTTLMPNATVLPTGPGVIISSGGSYRRPHQCLHPSSNLDLSAIATGEWLQKQGLEPKNCIVLNPLPLHHVSGLMPWWRSRVWGADHYWLMPSLMRDPKALKEFCKSIFHQRVGPFITSLVPTQLQRLIEHPYGLDWLKSFDLIWVGGSKLSNKLASHARREQIRLAPCYGATETAAMITSLAPNSFLAGRNDCGNPLRDVDLRLTQFGSLEIKTPRLSSMVWEDGCLKEIQDKNGWWQSGDLAKLTLKNCSYQLEILGRSDTAINSGGETIFPELLESKLLAAAKKAKIPVLYILFLPLEDKEWGERLIALICWESMLTTVEQQQQLEKIKQLIEEWQPAEKPFLWHVCNELEPTESGKFERSKWQNWLKANYFLSK